MFRGGPLFGLELAGPRGARFLLGGPLCQRAVVRGNGFAAPLEGLLAGPGVTVTSDTPGHLGALVEALVAADAPRLGRVAHRLLSVTQNIGAPRMSALCVEIERRCRLGEIDRVGELADALALEHERVNAALLAVRMRY